MRTRTKVIGVSAIMATGAMGVLLMSLRKPEVKNPGPFAATAQVQTQTEYHSGNIYKVPSGVIVTIEYPIKKSTADPKCNNWPKKPTRLPCFLDADARAYDNEGAVSTDAMRWHLCAVNPEGTCLY